MNELVIKKGESVTVLMDKNSFGKLERVYRLDAGSKLDFIYLGLPGNGYDQKKTDEYSFILDGDRSELNFYGFLIGKNSDFMNIKSGSVCLSRGCKANFEIKSALFDSSRVNFEGNMVIEKNGHDSESYLSHRTLLLSKNARTKTIPGLEIKANDVKAGHAATIGMVDDEDLFYLESRGINQKTAVEMIIKGYFETLLEKITDESVREKVTEQLFKYL